MWILKRLKVEQTLFGQTIGFQMRTFRFTNDESVTEAQEQSISCQLHLEPSETIVEEQAADCSCHIEADCSGKFVDVTGSVTTAYSYSDDLSDPNSQRFQMYAANIENEMNAIMLQSDSVDSITTTVTSFEPADDGRRRREAGEYVNAKANFEAVAEVAADSSADGVGTALENEVDKSIDDGNDVLLETDSFSQQRNVVSFESKKIGVLFQVKDQFFTQNGVNGHRVRQHVTAYKSEPD